MSKTILFFLSVCILKSTGHIMFCKLLVNTASSAVKLVSNVSSKRKKYKCMNMKQTLQQECFCLQRVCGMKFQSRRKLLTLVESLPLFFKFPFFKKLLLIYYYFIMTLFRFLIKSDICNH